MALVLVVVFVFVFVSEERHTKRYDSQAILLNFRLPWSKVHLGSSGLWLLWSCLFDGGVGGVGSQPSFYRTIVL